MPTGTTDLQADAVPISEFKARCLALIEQVRRTGRPLVVTRHGKPVAEVVAPSATRGQASWIGEAAGTFTITGDVTAPVSRPDDWEAWRS